jgi:hypothetical protein
MPSKIIELKNFVSKGCIIAAFFLLIYNAMQAQKAAENELAKILSYTNVDSPRNLDSAAMAKLLVKQYSLASYLYSITPKESLSASEKQFLDSIQLYIAKRYVAEIALKKIEANTTVSDQEALAYYNAHKETYSTIGNASYILGYIINENPNIVERAKKQMLLAAAQPDSLSYIGSMKNTDYSISVEKNALLSPKAQLTPHLQKLNVKQMSELLQIDGYNSKILLYVLSKTESSYLPFEQVKEDCRSRAKAEKIETSNQQLLKEAALKFPVLR